MPNRCQTNVHDAYYRWMAARDGEYCLACFIEKGIQRKGKLQIDHANNDITDWSPKNLHLLCPMHNLKMRKLTTQQHINLMRQYSAKNEGKREKISGGEAEDIVSAMVPRLNIVYDSGCGLYAQSLQYPCVQSKTRFDCSHRNRFFPRTVLKKPNSFLY